MSNKEQVDKAFREAFETYKPVVPEGSWEGVKTGINTFLLADMVKLKNRYRNAALALSVLLISIGSLYTLNYLFPQSAEISFPEKEIASVIPIDTVMVYRSDTVFQIQTKYVTKYVNKEVTLNELLANKKLQEEFMDYVTEQNRIISDKEKLEEKPKEVEIPYFDWQSLKLLSEADIKLLNVYFKEKNITYGGTLKRKLPRVKERIPLEDRLFFQVLPGTGTGKLEVKDNINDFGRDHGYHFGGFVGLDLTKRFWIKSGLKLSTKEYALSPFGRVEVNSEEINGAYNYVYRTPLGNLVIPNEKLLNPASNGSSIEIESHNNNRSKQLIIPIQLNYDFLNKDIRFLGYYKPLQFYAGLEAYLQKPLKNSVSMEIYESDGSEFNITLDKFSSLSNLSICGGIQAGAKLEIYPGWKLMSEAAIGRNFTYYVNNEYFRSYPKNMSISAGLEIKFK
jgi:hypothetical protein